MTTLYDYLGWIEQWRSLIKKTMGITDFKSHALKVLGDVAAHKEKVVVTKRGKPIVEVVPYSETNPAPGHLAQTLVFEKDIVSPLGEDLWDACK